MSRKFGQDGFRAVCPGLNLCERLTGAAGDSVEEQYEEARHGCPNKCNRLAEEKTEIADSETIAFEIETLVYELRAGNLSAQKCEPWQWELIIYYLRTEKDLERNVQIEMLERLRNLKVLAL